MRWAAFALGRRREQAVGFLAQGLGHAVGLAVGPDRTPTLEIHPVLLQRDDLGETRGELELQPDAGPADE